MQRYAGIVRDDNGRPVSGASVTVYQTNTTTLASLFSPAASAGDTPTTGITNPITTGSDGTYAFAASDGDYDIVESGANITTRYIYRVNLFDGTTATTGSQSSFALTMPTAVFDVSGSPGTSITVSFDTQTANYVFAGPTTGAAAAPTFRALVAADINSVAVDMSTAQAAIGGAKTWTGAATFSSTVAVTGAATFASTGSFAEPLTLSKELTLTAYNNSSPSNGDVWLDSTSKGLKFYSTSASHEVKAILYPAVASVTVGNTTNETTLLASAYTIPANYLVPGKVIRLRAYGTIGNTGTPTLRLKAKLGGATVCDTTALTMTAITGTNGFEIAGDITIRTAGASGTAIGYLKGFYQTANVTAPIQLTATTASTTTIDTTGNSSFDLTAQWGTANASNTLTITELILEV